MFLVLDSLVGVRVFIAGSTGVIGRRVIPLLVAQRHNVSAMTRDAGDGDMLAGLGAQPFVCDVYDFDLLREIVIAARPEIVVNLLTALPDSVDELEGAVAANARIRREGNRNLLEAAEAAGAKRVLAESVAWRLEGDAGAAVEELERAVLDAGGVVLRYGQLYGPGTYHEHERPDPPRVQIDEAARQTVEALHEPSGVIEIVDTP